MATLRAAHQLRFESVGAQLFADLLERHELPRTQLDDQRHQQALPAERALAPRPQVLLEEHALVRHVLVDDPQAFAVHRHDEAGAHLPQRLQVENLHRAGQDPPPAQQPMRVHISPRP